MKRYIEYERKIRVRVPVIDDSINKYKIASLLNNCKVSNIDNILDYDNEEIVHVDNSGMANSYVIVEITNEGRKILMYK